MKKTVAFLSIGQSPRQDVIGDFKKICGDTFHILDIGALDDLSIEEIQRIAPIPGESDLIVKLRTGQSAYVSHGKLMPYMQLAIQKAIKAGAEWIVILCTGDFSKLESSVPLLLPNTILAHSVASIFKAGDSLTVIVPTPGQASEAAERWSMRGFRVAKVIVESPFNDHQALFNVIENDSIVQDSQAIIADCFGFDMNFMKNAAVFYRKPIFVSRMLISHLLVATGSTK
ncbi:AroM family protein [Pelorhabdus rhamnosifermentans]|uniref:AroM family protein n=1 Tax=Pelorhabdus rhamnosifermentans TaxID=2772457 RepID=UPI001FE43C89|nr:AroM family protein [Pelorhabdus rhamnosifermentans]